MDKASLSPSSLTKQMFGDSADDDCEVLTPGQGVKTPEPAPPTPRGGADAPSETPPPPSDTAAQRGIGASATIAAPTPLYTVTRHSLKYTGC